MTWALKIVQNFGRQSCGVGRACQEEKQLEQRSGSLKTEADPGMVSGSGVGKR